MMDITADCIARPCVQQENRVREDARAILAEHYAKSATEAEHRPPAHGAYPR